MLRPTTSSPPRPPRLMWTPLLLPSLAGQEQAQLQGRRQIPTGSRQRLGSGRHTTYSWPVTRAAGLVEFPGKVSLMRETCRKRCSPLPQGNTTPSGDSFNCGTCFATRSPGSPKTRSTQQVGPCGGVERTGLLGAVHELLIWPAWNPPASGHLVE